LIDALEIKKIATGLNADGKKGYQGYKWKHKESVDLVCLVF